MFKDDNIVVLFDKVVKPDTFNDKTIVVLLFNIANPETLDGFRQRLVAFPARFW
jgi:hypothetical protein